MLVCHHPSLFFVSTAGQSQNDFLLFLDGKDSINTYLLNLIFESFAPLHLLCLLHLQCTCYHYEFSLV